MDANPIRWFEIYVQDMARAREFYETILGVTLQQITEDKPEMWAFPQISGSPGATGALASMEGVASGNNSTLVYFGCEDCAVEAGRVVPAGGQVCKDKFSIGEHGFIALAADPDGNMFGLHSLK